jgi:hypothetical protein
MQDRQQDRNGRAETVPDDRGALHACAVECFAGSGDVAG